MSEELKSCPICGNNDPDLDSVDGDYAAVMCCRCRMRGPEIEFCYYMANEKMEGRAIDAWNALPRALVWTSEPPKVAGWYWVKSGTVCYVSIFKYDANDIKYLKREEGTQWSGPIPEPQEPTNV